MFSETLRDHRPFKGVRIETPFSAVVSTARPRCLSRSEAHVVEALLFAANSRAIYSHVQAPRHLDKQCPKRDPATKFSK